MRWFAKISKPSDRVILHLTDLAYAGEPRTPLEGPEDLSAFLAAHPEVEAVNVYSSDFPRRPVPVAKFDPRMIAKLFAAPKAARRAAETR